MINGKLVAGDGTVVYQAEVMDFGGLGMGPTGFVATHTDDQPSDDSDDYAK